MSKPDPQTTVNLPEYYDLVKIEWIDSMGCGKWVPADEPEKDTDLHCVSYGLLTHRDKVKTRITPHFHHRTGQGDGILNIPNVAIKKVTVLKKKAVKRVQP